MDGSEGSAAPTSGNTNGNDNGNDSSDAPGFEELAADPGIAALLDFEPVPRQRKRRGGWTAALQKRFIAELTQSGSPTLAAEAVDKKLFSATRLYKTAGADSFRAAWDGAVALFEERSAAQIHAGHSGLAALKPPMVDRRRTRARWDEPDGPPPGHVITNMANMKMPNRSASAARRRRTASAASCSGFAGFIWRGSAHRPASAPRSRF